MDGINILRELFVVCFVAVYDLPEGCFVDVFRSFADGRYSTCREGFCETLGEFGKVGKDAEAAETLAKD